MSAGSPINELAPLLTTGSCRRRLFHLEVDGGPSAAGGWSSYVELKVVVLGLNEDEAQVVACARAGIAGYVTPDATLHELTSASARQLLGIAVPRHCCNATPQPCRSEVGRMIGMVAARLTPREAEIVQLIERGMSNKEIARHLTIQLATVKNHVHNILEKLAVRDRADAVRRGPVH